MSLFVIDANVAVKWFLAESTEPLRREALALLDKQSRHEIDFVVPDLFWVEFANVVWKAARTGRMTKKSAEASLASLDRLDFPTVSSRTLIHTAFQIATTFERTLYDSLYVALAVQSKAQLITADERLANALASHLPVKSLRAF